MGGNFSGDENGNKAQIKEFQTKAQWRAYFDACKETNKLLVIDFSATWCGPCKNFEPTFKEFAATYTEVDFIKIDVDKLSEVAREFQVEAMPTFILIKNGKELARIVGARRDELQNMIEKNRK